MKLSEYVWAANGRNKEKIDAVLQRSMGYLGATGDELFGQWRANTVSIRCVAKGD